MRSISQDAIRSVHEALEAYAIADELLTEERRRLSESQAELAHLREAQTIVQFVGEAVHERLCHRLSDVVTRCLCEVFDDPYEFRIEFDRKRGRTEASLVFVRDGMTVDPLSASGGGVVDVAALVLRLAVMMLQRPAVRRLLVMDEPLRFLSKDYRPLARYMLKSLQEEFGMQFIYVTHIPELTTGKVVEL